MKNADVSIFLAYKSHKEQFNNRLTDSIQQDESEKSKRKLYYYDYYLLCPEYYKKLTKCECRGRK